MVTNTDTMATTPMTSSPSNLLSANAAPTWVAKLSAPVSWAYSPPHKLMAHKAAPTNIHFIRFILIFLSFNNDT